MIFESILGYKSSWRLIELFSETPIKLISKPEIRLHTRLGNESINEGIKRLKNSKILILEKRGKKEFYYLNMGNHLVRKLLELIKEERKELRNIPYEEMTIISEFLRKVNDKTKKISGAFVFGSTAKGISRKGSDLDICLITEKKELNDEMIITEISEKLYKQFGRKIQPVYFTKDEFYKAKKNNLIEEIKKNGIEL